MEHPCREDNFFLFLCIGQLEHAKCTNFGAAICWLRDKVVKRGHGLLRTFRKGDYLDEDEGGSDDWFWQELGRIASGYIGLDWLLSSTPLLSFYSISLPLTWL